jgi:hypothetical protein
MNVVFYEPVNLSFVFGLKLVGPANSSDNFFRPDAEIKLEQCGQRNPSTWVRDDQFQV